MMLEFPKLKLCVYRLVTMALVVSMLAIATSFGQTAKTYAVELAVPDGKKTVMTDADIIFSQNGIRIVPDKAKMKENTKDFAYSNIKQADASYAKKPMLSGGGAVATALLVGFIFALPFLFIKKKKHWMTVQTEKEFAVMQLGDNNWQEIAAEFQTRGVKVNDLKEQGK